MAFTHGRGMSVLLNAFDLSAFLNSADQTITVETAETTCFGSAAKSYVVGLRDGTISIGGFFDGAASAVDEIMSAAVGNTSASVLSIAEPGAGTVGNRALVCQSMDTSYQITGSVSDAVTVSAEFQVDGTGSSGAYRGVVLAPLTSNTNTTLNYTSVDNGASTANGLVANVHVTANTATNLVVKVQHSTDNSTWTDLITFATIATTGSEHKVASGTVNRYIRASWTGNSGTRTVAVTAARK